MATYYVAANGNDGANGSNSTPFKTISKGASVARAGDTVVVKNGNYPGRVNINCNGTSSARITIKSENKHGAVIDGNGTGANQDLVVIGGDFVIFDGFEVKNATKGGIVLWDSHDTTVKNCKAHDCESAAIYSGGSVNNCKNNVIEDNEVYHSVLQNESKNTSGGWARGIGVDMSDNIIIRRNKSYNNYGEGIGVMCCIKAQLLDNISYDNYSVLLYLDNAQEALVQRNIAWAENQEYFRNGKPALGVSICNENTSRMLPSTGINVTNNTLGGVGKPAYSEYGANTGLHNSVIEPNNICSVQEAKAEAGNGGGTDPGPTPPNPEPEEDLVVTINIDVPEGVEVKVNVNED